MLRGTSDDEPFSLRIMLGDAARSMRDEIKKLGLFLGAMGFLLLINFIPGIGSVVFGLCSVILTLYFLVVEYTGFYFSRKRIPFAQQRVFIRTHRAQSLGFGIAVMLTLMLPLLQFFTIPLSVVAATSFCVTNMDSELLQPHKQL
jgi:CysZ protein